MYYYFYDGRARWSVARVVGRRRVTTEVRVDRITFDWMRMRVYRVCVYLRTCVCVHVCMYTWLCVHVSACIIRMCVRRKVGAVKNTSLTTASNSSCFSRALRHTLIHHTRTHTLESTTVWVRVRVVLLSDTIYYHCDYYWVLRRTYRSPVRRQVISCDVIHANMIVFCSPRPSRRRTKRVRTSSVTCRAKRVCMRWPRTIKIILYYYQFIGIRARTRLPAGTRRVEDERPRATLGLERKRARTVGHGGIEHTDGQRWIWKNGPSIAYWYHTFYRRAMWSHFFGGGGEQLSLVAQSGNL